MPAPKLSRSEWGLVFILATINFTHIVDFVIVMPLGNRLMTELSLTEAQFGHIVSAYGIAAALAGLTFALVADRFDRKVSLLAAYTGFAVATLFCGFADTYNEMLVARFFAGAFGGVAASGIMAVIGDAFADGRRGTATGAVMSAFAVASIAGLPAGLWLANRYGRGAPFFAVAAASVPVLLVAVFRMRPFRGHLGTDRGNAAVALYRAAVNPAHVRSFAFMTTVVFGTFTIIPFIAPYMESNGGRSKDDIPAIYAIAGACTLVCLNVFGRLTDRIGTRPVFLALCVLSMVMTLVITHLPAVSFTTAAVVTSLFMVTAAGRGVPGQALMLGAADPATRGAFVSLNTAVQHLGTGLAPLLAGLFLGRDELGRITGYGTAGIVAVGIAAFSLVLAFAVKPMPVGTEEPALEEPMAEPALA
jgi:predicted MFS family arabinose efflux permease